MCTRICFLFLIFILHIPFQRADRSGEDGSSSTGKLKNSHFSFLFSRPSPPPPPPPGSSKIVLPKYLRTKKKLEPAGVPMKKLTWTEQIIPLQQVTENSVWANNDYTRNASGAVLEYLRNNFSNIRNASVDIRMAKLSAKAKMPQVIDPACIMPLQILQASCNRTCAAECGGVAGWRKAILEVDEEMLNGADNKQIIEQIRDKWPSNEVMSKLNKCAKDTAKNGCSDKMVEGEQFVLQLATIPGLTNRLGTILLKLEWKDAVDDLKYSISTLAATCEEIRTSKGLQKFLPFVLLAGNYLSKSSKSSDAFAFELSVLTKLTDTKAQKAEEGKIQETLLHSIIELFDKKYEKAHTQFALKEFPTIAEATKISLNAATYTSAYIPIQNEPDKFLEKVGAFIKIAEIEMADINKKWDDMQKKCAKLQEYLSFDPKKYSLEKLFDDIKQFQGQYAAALEDIKKKKEDNENEKTKKPTIVDMLKATKKKLSHFAGHSNKKVIPDKGLPLQESGDKALQNPPTAKAEVLPKSTTAPVSTLEPKLKRQGDAKENLNVGWPLQKFGDKIQQNPSNANAGVEPKIPITSASQPSGTRDDSANNQRTVEERKNGTTKDSALPESGVSTGQTDATISDDRVRFRGRSASVSQKSSARDDSANNSRKVEEINTRKDLPLLESGVSTRQTGPTSGDRVQPKESERTGENSISTAPVQQMATQ